MRPMGGHVSQIQTGAHNNLPRTILPPISKKLIVEGLIDHHDGLAIIWKLQTRQLILVA